MGALSGTLELVKQGKKNLPKLIQEYGDRLLVQHKLTSKNLRNADQIGGLPMPSIGIGRVDVPIEGYGDITLIGDKSMVKPGARNPVYSADAYSPTYPRVQYTQDNAALESLNDQLSDVAAKVKDRPFYPSSLEDGAESLAQNRSVMAKYLQDRGVDINFPDDMREYEIERSLRQKIAEVGQGDFDAYANDLFNSLDSKERLFFGYTDMGNRRYKPHTLDNVVKRMKEDMKDNNQTSMFGSGALRAQVAPRFRKLSDIQDARGRIKPPEELEAIKGELNDRLLGISGKFDDYSTYQDSNQFIASDVNRERLLEIAQGHATYDEYFPGAPQKIIDEWELYLDDLKNAPTGYFEAKPQRAVDIGEFQGALIPDDAPDDIVKILKSHGINRIERFSDESDRALKVKSFEDMLFAPAAAAVGLGAAVAPEDAEAAVEPQESLTDKAMKGTGKALNFAFDAIEMPSRGLHGLAAALGVLAETGSWENALLRGAEVSGQSIDETAKDLGEYVADKTGSAPLAALTDAVTRVATLEP